MNKEKLNFIYKTTCLVNGLIYVGRQSEKTSLRLNYFGSGIGIKAAIKEFGKENFTREILEFCDNVEDLKDKETFWIKELNSINPEIGYNRTSVSSKSCLGKNWEWTEEQKKNRPNNAGENHPQFGTRGEDTPNFGNRWSYTKEQKKSITGENNHLTGTKWSDERRANQPDNSGEKNPMFGRRGMTHTCSESCIESLRLAALSRPKEKCIYCGYICDYVNLRRWHNENCKHKPK